jgi:hypothetical protein
VPHSSPREHSLNRAVDAGHHLGVGRRNVLHLRSHDGAKRNDERIHADVHEALAALDDGLGALSEADQDVAADLVLPEDLDGFRERPEVLVDADAGLPGCDALPDRLVERLDVDADRVGTRLPDSLSTSRSLGGSNWTSMGRSTAALTARTQRAM